MLQQSQQHVDTDSDITRFSGPWSPCRNNDFDGETMNYESDEEDNKPLIDSKYCSRNTSEFTTLLNTNGALDTHTATPLTPPNNSFGNSAPPDVAIDYTHPMVEELMKNVGTLTRVAHLHKSTSPATFLKKIGERKDTAQIGEEVFKETRRDLEKLIFQKTAVKSYTEDSNIVIYSEDRDICENRRATPAFKNNLISDSLSKENRKRENATSPFFSKASYRSPRARINPSPAARKHYECYTPNGAKNFPTITAVTEPKCVIQDRGISFKINSETAVTSNFRFKSNSDRNNANSVPKNSEIETIDDSDTLLSELKKSTLKSTVVPLSKYFKINKKLKKEKKKRKLLQCQINEMTFNSGVKSNTSDSIAKLITMPSIGPFVFREVRKDTVSQVQSNIQKCEECPCICPKRKLILPQNNSDIKYLTSLMPNLPPILKNKLFDNLLDTEHLNNVASLMNNHSEDDSLRRVSASTVTSATIKNITDFSSPVIRNPSINHSFTAFTSPMQFNPRSCKDFKTKQNSQQFSHGPLPNSNFFDFK